mmetsp:Transcript_34399/g.111033  ORF Transcript_34399/g.111033 Transcript_34399/m.111033 type:complete len:207 (-) Transcript_34399:436-1056(-)
MSACASRCATARRTYSALALLPPALMPLLACGARLTSGLSVHFAAAASNASAASRCFPSPDNAIARRASGLSQAGQSAAHSSASLMAMSYRSSLTYAADRLESTLPSLAGSISFRAALYCETARAYLPSAKALLPRCRSCSAFWIVGRGVAVAAPLAPSVSLRASRARCLAESKSASAFCLSSAHARFLAASRLAASRRAACRASS